MYYAEAADSLDDMATRRRARLTIAGQELPLLLQVLVFGGALVILPMTFLHGTWSRRMQLMFVAAVAALIGFSLLLVVVLDRPFAGDLSVSPELFTRGKLGQFSKPRSYDHGEGSVPFVRRASSTPRTWPMTRQMWKKASGPRPEDRLRAGPALAE